MVLLHFVEKKDNFKLLFAKASDQNIKYAEMERAYPFNFRRMQIVKSFAIPQFMSKASLIYVSQTGSQQRIFRFYLEGKDKIKWLALINDIKYGGLKMLDLLESMILAQRTMNWKNILKVIQVRPWKFFWAIT